MEKRWNKKMEEETEDWAVFDTCANWLHLEQPQELKGERLGALESGVGVGDEL